MQPFAILMIRIFAAYLMANTLSQFAYGTALYFNTEMDVPVWLVTGYYTVQFLVGLVLWIKAAWLARRALPDMEQNEHPSITAQDIVASGGVLIGMYWLGTGLLVLFNTTYRRLTHPEVAYPVWIIDGSLVQQLSLPLFGLCLILFSGGLARLFTRLRRL